MFGFRYTQFQPNEFVIQYHKGQVKRSGTSLSCWYYAPKTTMVMLPVGSKELPFMLEELTADFQTVTVQGHLVYRISDFNQLTELMNFGIDVIHKSYLSDDPIKLSQRVINMASVCVKKRIEKMTLTTAIQSTDALATQVLQDLSKSVEIKQYGLELLGFSILAITPNKETTRALEAQTREAILKLADDAIYARRNAAILQERTIRENELNTEKAVVDKQREIADAEMASKRQKQTAEHQLIQSQLDFEIAKTETQKQLVISDSENQKIVSEAKIYELSQIMSILKTIDPLTIRALVSQNVDAKSLIAFAFQDLAQNANKIGTLNISPDLLKQLLSDGRDA